MLLSPLASGVPLDSGATSALLIVLLLGCGVVDFHAGFRLERAERFVAANDNFISDLQTLSDLNVGHAGDAGFDGPEEGFLAVDDEYALNLILLGITSSGWRRSSERDAGLTAPFGIL